MNIIIICCVAAAVIVCLTYFLVQYFNFNKTGAKKFSFIRYFPFELFSFKPHHWESYLNGAGLVSCFVLCTIPAILFAAYKTYASSYVMMTMFILAFLCFYFLIFIKLSYYKFHILVAAFLTGLTLSLILTEIYCFTLTSTNSYFGVENNNLTYVIFAINIIQLIFEFVLLLNPNYKTWYKMVKVDAEVFSRPKFNYLCCIEWGSFINLFICYIPLIIAL